MRNELTIELYAVIQIAVRNELTIELQYAVIQTAVRNELTIELCSYSDSSEK